jgi:hypothetical protein
MPVPRLASGSGAVAAAPDLRKTKNPHAELDKPPAGVWNSLVYHDKRGST